MQRLLRKFWKRSQSQVKSTTGNVSQPRPQLLGAEDSLNDNRQLIKIKLGPHLFISLEFKALITLLLSIVIYTCAAFLANEWLYLLFSGLVVLVLTGCILPLTAVLTVKAESSSPPQVIAESSSVIIVTLKRLSWLNPLSWAFPVDCLRVRVILAKRSTEGYLVEQTLSKQPILIERLQKEAQLEIQVPLLQRGVYKLAAVEIGTSFPFGMCWCSKRMEPQSKDIDNIVVFPKSWTLNGSFLLELKGQLSSMGISLTEALAFTQSSSVRSIRDFRQGDSLRHIHWPSSARSGKLLVREFDSETLPVFDLHLDLHANWRTIEQFELAVSLTASLINFGYDHDILPELHLHPPVTHEDLAPLMFDLPPAKPPLEMLSEILARVEPLPPRSSQIPADLSPTRQLLSIRPATDSIMRHHAQRGQQVVYPIQLIAIGHNETSGTNSSNQMVIATIYSEDELWAL